MKTATIEINESKILLKRNFQTLINFELQTGVDAYKADTSINHSLNMFYAMIRANNEKFAMSFQEFIAYLDIHPECYRDYLNFTSSLLQEEKAVKPKKKAETR